MTLRKLFVLFVLVCAPFLAACSHSNGGTTTCTANPTAPSCVDPPPTDGTNPGVLDPANVPTDWQAPIRFTDSTGNPFPVTVTLLALNYPPGYAVRGVTGGGIPPVGVDWCAQRYCFEIRLQVCMDADSPSSLPGQVFVGLYWGTGPLNYSGKQGETITVSRGSCAIIDNSSTALNGAHQFFSLNNNYLILQADYGNFVSGWIDSSPHMSYNLNHTFLP